MDVPMRFQLAASALLATPLLALCGPAAAAVTLISGEVNTDPAVNFRTENPNFTFTERLTARPGHDGGLSAAKRDLFASTEAFATNPLGAGGADAHALVEAHWNADNAGGAVIVDSGWSLPAQTAANEEFIGSTENPTGAAAWSYTFSVDRNSVFDLGLRFTADGDTNGMGSWALTVVDNGSDPRIDQLLLLRENNGFNVTGQTSHNLRAGHTYTLALVNEDIHGIEGVRPTVAAREQGQFDWSIAASGAPEPATWALSIVGFGLAGAGLRRRRGEKLA
jgi:hypothetical protein